MTQLSQSNVERVALVYISVYFFSCISLIVYFSLLPIRFNSEEPSTSNKDHLQQ
ncbi:BBT_collapsed_G0035340.mRNA.1.CDS.1 [Saccharomyces cerevisiae]|nr:BBT_collapsed_G0035340.mRNA.1.CDS.1 [Saccharomyces cerevisiae]